VARVPEPADVALDRDLVAVAGRHPDRVAVTGVGQAVCFSALDQLVDRAAERLSAHGVGAGRFVTVELDRSVEAIVCVLALWRLGAAPVPLDPWSPEPFRRSSVDGVGGLVSHRITAPPLDDRWDVAAVPADHPEPSPAPVGGPDLAAYGMFTSGTTGRRRLVVVGHRQLEHLRDGLRATAYAGLAPASSVGLNAPMAFDASLQQIVQVADGSTLVLVPREVRADGHAMRRHLRRHDVAVLDATPGLVRRWWDQGALDGPEGPLVDRLLVGGEAIDAHLWAGLRDVEGMQTYNLYGPTECTVDTMVGEVAGDLPHLGRPMPGATVQIEDGRGPVADYVVGELVIGGAGVSWGYAGSAAGGFVDGPSGRRYRTGDLVRRHRDGTVEFVGRRDDQVKVDGTRIDLSEVDALVREAPGVVDAVAAVAPEGHLVAVVTVEVGAPGTGEDVRADVAARAPLAYVPAEITIVGTIPLTDRGKVDRRSVAGSVADPGGPPEGDLEVLVATTMADVAGGGIFRRDESFFRRGGGSLGVLEVVARLADAVGFEVDVATVVARPTPRAVAALLATPHRPSGSHEIATPGVQRDGLGPVDDPHPDPSQEIAARSIECLGFGWVDAGGSSRTTRRPLSDAMACGAIPGLDAASLAAVPDVARPFLGSGDDLRSLMGGLPLLVRVRRTALGSLGIILLPCYATEVMVVGRGLVEPAVTLAATLGARAVSLTGGLAPATDHGTALACRAAGPIVTTGQGSSVAAMLAAWEAACRAEGRPPAGEHLGLAGRGTLTDAFADAVVQGADGPASVGRLDPDRPETTAAATSIVVTGSIDSARLLRATGDHAIVVEYDTGLAPGRGPRGVGPWVVSGSALRSPEPIEDLTYVDDRMAGLSPVLTAQALAAGGSSIAACALAALLVANGEAPAVRSVPDPAVVTAYRVAHRRRRFAPDLAMAAVRAGRG
jgi:acyl-coenzyme A synthetase/AMP-(fatty) acid ligase